MEDENLQLEFSRYFGHEKKWRLMFTFAVVLEELTSHASSDPVLYVYIYISVPTLSQYTYTLTIISTHIQVRFDVRANTRGNEMARNTSRD